MATYNPYAAQEADIARRKHMADVLEEQAFKPIQQFSYNGIPAPISPLSGLAKVLSSYTAGKLGREAAAAGVKLNEQQGTDTSAAYDYERKLSLGDPSAVAPPVIPPGMGAAIVKAQIAAGHLARFLADSTGQSPPVVGGAPGGAATATPQPLTPPVAPDGAATATPQPLTPLGAPGGVPTAASQPTNRVPNTLEGLKAAYETAHADSIRLGKLAAGNPNYKAGADQARKDADLYLKALMDKGFTSTADLAAQTEIRRHNLATELQAEITTKQTALKQYFDTGYWAGPPGTEPKREVAGSPAAQEAITRAMIPLIDKKLDEQQTSATASARAWAGLQMIKDQSEAAPQGSLAGLQLSIGNFLASFGIKGAIGNQTTAGVLLESAKSGVLRSQMQALGARGLTDRDMAILKDNLPKLGASPEARIAVADVLQRQEYQNMGEFNNSLKEYEKQYPGYSRPRPLWLKEFTEGKFDAAPAAGTAITPRAVYDKLPLGATYVGPDGITYTKGAQ